MVIMINNYSVHTHTSWGEGGGNRGEGSITFVAIGFKPSIYMV